MNRPSAGCADAPLFAWGDALRAAKARRRMLVRRGGAAAVTIAAVCATIVAPPLPRLVWNASASAPLGLYAVTPGAPLARGDMAVARLPHAMRRLAAARHYIPENVPLVKRVGGVAGDEMCALGGTIYRDGQAIAVRKASDAHGRPLPVWHGCRMLRGSQVFLLMDAPDSFDGRYFGITQGSDIVGKARLLWAR